MKELSKKELSNIAPASAETEKLGLDSTLDSQTDLRVCDANVTHTNVFRIDLVRFQAYLIIR
jgi:hypothetical protein